MTKVTLTTRIPLIAANLQGETREALLESARAIVVDAQSRVPTDTEDLKKAIQVVELEDGSISVQAGDDEDVYYGHLVENGRADPNYPPRPFLIPALETERPNINETIGEKVAGI